MLFIMRHGKTEWNAINKLQGRTDIPLNDEGRQMARDAYEKYKSVNIDICYCSPLKRASETAKIVIGNRDIPIVTDERLVEMSFGDYEGVENYFHDSDCPINILFKEPEKYVGAVGGAETFDELYARTGEFIKEIIEPQLQEGKDILIVGHGAMNSCIICQLKDIPVRDFWSAGLKQCEMLKLY